MKHVDRAEPPELVILGPIVRAQGLRGAVRVKPVGVEPEVALQLVDATVFVRSAEDVRETVLESQRWHGGMWIVELRGCTTRDDAESLVGCTLCIDEKDRPELGPDCYYDDDLVGMRVVDAHTDGALGEVVGVKPSPAANLLRVRRPDGRDFLLPAVRAMITEIDPVSRLIRVDLPDGLVELNEN